MLDHPIAGPSIAKLCQVCSQLNTQHLSYPFFPCHNPLPCSTPPVDGYFAASIALGPVKDIYQRRSTCDLCNLVAKNLVSNEEPDSECRIRECAQFCTFTLPRSVQFSDPTKTHVHLTQTLVILDAAVVNDTYGPSLPWKVKSWDQHVSRTVLAFQTRARSSSKYCADAITVSLRTEQAFLTSIGGRHVGAQVNVQLVQAWLHECEREHGMTCTPSLQLPQERGRSPTFVIDVLGSCLVNTPLHCRYVALSYVWGRAAVFKHLLENTKALHKTGALHGLCIPATIRDSMTLVRAIGERYLWVDSICIIQDDLKMQQDEIMQMGSIYSRALFTIVAAAGDHADSGLPGIEPGSREEKQKTLKLANNDLLTVIDLNMPSEMIDDTVWAQRGWTFQENILSNRLLVFSTDQVYWRCRGAVYEEERALEQIQDIDRLRLAFPQKYADNSLSWEPLDVREYCSHYRDLLESYLVRQLTYRTDILNAFNGVTEILGVTQNDTFFWGLPESIFSYAITWSFMGYCARAHVQVPVFQRDGKKQTIYVPTWSWAAWSGACPTLQLEIVDGYHNVIQPVVQFNVVDTDYRLAKIKERAWQARKSDHQRASWQSAHQLDVPTALAPNSQTRIGQLQFWSSIANVRAVREMIQEGRTVHYTLSPPPNFQPDPDAAHNPSKIVYQDFVVVAARGSGIDSFLVLLAVEWEDGVAYRVGIAEVKELEWVRVENREWRWITLG